MSSLVDLAVPAEFKQTEETEDKPAEQKKTYETLFRVSDVVGSLAVNPVGLLFF